MNYFCYCKELLLPNSKRASNTLATAEYNNGKRYRMAKVRPGVCRLRCVESDTLRTTNQSRAYGRETQEKLYLSVRAEHAKAKQRRQAEKKKMVQAEQLPKTSHDLEVKKKEDTGHLRYAYNGLEVLVTPRKHREKRDAEGREGKAAWRDRELTPDRALRKLRDKIKRSLNKAA